MRCFVAIELPETTVLALGAAGQVIRDLDSTWRGEKWVAPEVMHVTLKFLGDVPASMIDRLGTDLAAATAHQRPFSVRLGSLRGVPRSSRTSMIWAMIDDSGGRCSDLAREIERVATRHGFQPESRSFAPHVTLTRARRPHGVSLEALNEAVVRSRVSALEPVSVLSATLFASTLTPLGPIHERLRELTLDAE